MTQTIQTVRVVTKARNAEANALGETVAAWLRTRGVTCTSLPNPEDSGDLGAVIDDADLVLVLGGDGTLLSVARKLGDTLKPLLGINFGQVGFLTELTRHDWQEGLLRVLAGDCHFTERVALTYEVIRGGDVIATDRAINDLVVNRGGLARLITLDVSCGEDPLGAFRADGLVVFTPTGATAYAVSAGGPLVHPDLDVIGLTPICPFLSDFKPLILPADREVRITVSDHPDTVYLTLDGQTGFTLATGDTVIVRKAAGGPKFLTLEKASYFEKLRSKGYFKER